jgi:hypothetical protein
VKHFSTPSKPTSLPNNTSQDPVLQNYGAVGGVELAAHYAGPTFHSSPAPSSLPMPSFFASKQKSTLQNGAELESSPEQSTPVKSVRSLDGRNFDDSPLAPFFKADQEEKLRLHNKYTTHGVFGSPTLRPSSTDGIPEHLNICSESPLLWNDSPHKAKGRFDFKSIYIPIHYWSIDHSTSELPFQMDSEFENWNPPRNHLVERFRATTEPPSEYRPSPKGRMDFNHSSQPGQQEMQFSLRREPQLQQPPDSDLETSTRTLKHLLSIPPFPSPSKSPTISNGPHYSSTIQHQRTRSAAQESLNGTVPRPQRIVSSPGIHGIKRDQRSQESQKEVLEEAQTTKMEKELRKVLNLI